MPFDPNFKPARLHPRTGSHGLGNSTWTFTDNAAFDFVSVSTDLDGNAEAYIDYIEDGRVYALIFTCPDAQTSGCVELVATWELNLKDWIGELPNGTYTESDPTVSGNTYHCISGWHDPNNKQYIHTARTIKTISSDECAVIVFAKTTDDVYSASDVQTMLTGVLGQISR